jgi:hypothetical protein
MYGRYHLEVLGPIQLYLIFKFLFWKLMVVEFVLAISHYFLLLGFARKVKIALLLGDFGCQCWFYGRCSVCNQNRFS